MTLGYASKGDQGALIKLFCDTFGDSEKFVRSFYGCFDCTKHTLVAKDGKDILAMVNLIPLTLPFGNGTVFHGKYVYALATKESYRKKGIARSLLGMAESDCDFLFLIPANSSLATSYRRMGFDRDAYRLFPSELPPGSFPTSNLSEEHYDIYTKANQGNFCMGYDAFCFARSSAELFAFPDGYAVMENGILSELCPANNCPKKPHGLYKKLIPAIPEGITPCSAMMLE